MHGECGQRLTLGVIRIRVVASFSGQRRTTRCLQKDEPGEMPIPIMISAVYRFEHHDDRNSTQISNALEDSHEGKRQLSLNELFFFSIYLNNLILSRFQDLPPLHSLQNDPYRHFFLLLNPYHANATLFLYVLFLSRPFTDL